LLIMAIYRLSPYTFELLQQPLSLVHYVALVGSCLFMAYSEGYKGFQKSFSPRVVSRARCLLTDDAKLHWRLLAPLFCMSWFAAPRKRKIVVAILTLMIVCCVVGMKYVPQPWRGIIDAGVLVGLSWGIASIIYCCYLGSKGLLKSSPELA